MVFKTEVDQWGPWTVETGMSLVLDITFVVRAVDPSDVCGSVVSLILADINIGACTVESVCSRVFDVIVDVVTATEVTTCDVAPVVVVDTSVDDVTALDSVLVVTSVVITVKRIYT